LLTIWFGANDACLPKSPQHISLDDFTQALAAMISLVRDPSSSQYSPETGIILITPPPFNSKQSHVSELAGLIAADRRPEITKSYANAVRELGDKEGIPVLDAWTLLWDAAGKDEQNLAQFLTDGLHLNAQGYEVQECFLP
jgi:lysophospholipase L1-like esterase